MGHGWKTVAEREVSKKPCACGKGYIVEYEETEECDYPPFDRTSTYTKHDCPDNCHLKKK
jgi:hypothetical protein